MAKNQQGVRITIDEEMDPLKASEMRRRTLPSEFNTPEAALNHIMANYGKDGVVSDPVVLNHLFRNEEYNTTGPFGYLSSPDYDAIPKRDYDSILEIFKEAYNDGNTDAITLINDMIRESSDYKARRDREIQNKKGWF